MARAGARREEREQQREEVHAEIGGGE
jgi:hypothetical protein